MLQVTVWTVPRPTMYTLITTTSPGAPTMPTAKLNGPTWLICTNRVSETGTILVSSPSKANPGLDAVKKRGAVTEYWKLRVQELMLMVEVRFVRESTFPVRS